MRFSPILLMSALVLSACGAPVAQVSTASPSPSASVAASASAAPTVEPTAEASPTPEATPTPASLSNEEIAETLRPATVRIVAEYGETAIDYEGLGAGTGVVYDLDNGYIITNAHVVEGASVVKIALADSTKTRSARVVGRSQCDDLAVLKVENTEDLAAAKLGDSAKMKVGADVVALGYPLSFDLGTDLSINAGSISQLKAQLGKYENLIKIDAAINHGNSGGPLVNRRGEVIGINTLGFDEAQQQNYAIAMSQAKPIIDQLQEGKNRHFIGLNLYPNVFSDYFGTEDGMAVIGVASGSPGSQAGIQPADLLLKMEGKSINSEEAVCDILRSHADGDQIKVTMLRAATGEILEGELTLGKVGAADDKTVKLAVVGNVGGDTQDDSGDQASGGTTDDQASTTDDSTVVNTTFDGDDVGTWPTGDADGLSANVGDGDYNVHLETAQQYAFIHPDESASLDNGVIAVHVRPEGNGLAGVMARYTETDGNRSMYVCWINNEGKFGCSKDVNNNWTVIVKPQVSDAVVPNDYNMVTMAVIGNNIVLQINDQNVATITDDSLTTGAWGVYAENYDDPFDAHYNEIAIINGD